MSEFTTVVCRSSHEEVSSFYFRSRALALEFARKALHLFEDEPGLIFREVSTGEWWCDDVELVVDTHHGRRPPPSARFEDDEEPCSR